ncbi:MAG: LysE family translocator [Candidatus Hodarchaeales archaeon]
MPYIQTFIFGITLAISIGPIAILILNRSMNCGLRNGLLCGLGAATADLTYAIVAFSAGHFFFPYLELQQENIPLVSAAVLVIFSLWMIYSSLKNRPSNDNQKYSLNCNWPFLTTYGLTMANPLTIIVFIGFSGLILSESSGNIFLHAIVILIASLIIQTLIALAGNKLANLITKPSTLLYFNLASSLGIMLFGISKLF